MSIIINNIRRQEKATNTASVVPTIPPNEDHTSGLWTNTDIYERELFINLADKKLFTRVGASIVSLGVSINGTGFVKAAGSVLSYDNSTYLTTISGIAAGGELSGSYPNPTLVNSAVTGKILTGLSVTGGTIISSDSILTALGKLQNQVNSVVGSMDYQGTWNANTNSPTLTSSVGTKGFVYRVTTSGSTNLDGITDWKAGDFVVYNGTTYDKWDSTDAVTSVNGYVGNVSLMASDLLLTGYVSGAGVVSGADTVLQGIQKLNGNIATKQNTLSGTGIVKSVTGTISYINGTSSQFVKADGSLDSSTFLSTTTGWALNGNAGFGNDTTWIGTSDNQSFLVKTNNTLLLTFDKGGYVYNTGLANKLENTVFGNLALSSNSTGTEITAFGYRALRSATAGTYSSAFGAYALDVSTGTANTAFGAESQIKTTTGVNNASFGAFSLSHNQTGSFNTAIGVNSLQASTSDNNTAVGYYSLGQLTSGANMTALGLSAGFSSTTNSNCVFLGYSSGYYETGSGKLFIDNQSRSSEADARLKSLIYGIFDVAVANQRLTINGNVGIQGTQSSSTSLTIHGLGSTSITYGLQVLNSSSVLSLQVLDDGSVFNNGAGANFNNSAFGQNALITNTSGDSNTANGTYALWKNTTGNNNTAGGWGALAQNISGSNNTAFGFQSCLTATNVSGNSGFGYLTLNVSTQGGNSAFGYISCYQVTTGQSNTGLGYATLQALKTGSFNTAAGTNCLQACLGSDNTGVGYYTLGNLTSGSKNTAVGENAAFTLTTTDRGAFFGYGAGYYETQGNKLYIHVDSGSISNESDGRLQSLIYGIFGNGAVNQTLALNALKIIMQYLPVGIGGTVSGQVYVDTAANALINGDNILILKS